ncbi:MAG: SWIM zinc finger family protein [Acidobacteria bacterium]|nr:SWIM zinc finger family protein [Acidobacteriota bacterium]
MPISWTSEQVIAQAPDESSVKAGRGLASPAKWVSSGYDDRAVWGECKGSGKLPYQVSIELAEPAFKCSCPSRKFPCKHGLGLFLLYAAAQLKEGSAPDFCAEWLAKRSATEERKNEKAAAETTPEEDAKREKARLKRVADREAKVAAGLAELELWLGDLVRQGLATAQNQPTEYWEKTAKRLIDAQSPNAARLVRNLSSLVYRKDKYGERLAGKLLEQIGRLYLVCESWRRLAELPEAVRADVKTAVGFTVKEDELTAAETIEDVWQVHGIRVYEEEKLRVQRIWLAGETSGRRALVLNFAFRNQPLDVGFTAGTRIRAALAFYPGNFPQRAFVKERFEAANLDALAAFDDFDALLGDYAAALAKNVWLETFPAMIRRAVPVRRGAAWFLRDETGKLLPLEADEAALWKLDAVCGDRPTAIFSEWDGETLRPLTVWSDGKPIRL